MASLAWVARGCAGRAVAAIAVLGKPASGKKMVPWRQHMGLYEASNPTRQFKLKSL